MADVRGPLDEYLVLRCQTGDSQAFGQLVSRWHPRLTRHAKRMVRDPELAADALQESWLAIQRGICRLHDPARFAVWALSIVSNKCADQVRAQTRRRRIEGEAGVRQTESNAVLNQSVVTDDLDVLRDALAGLDDAKRAVVELHYLEDLTVAEISAVLGIPTGTVKSRLHHARTKLAAAMGRTKTSTTNRSNDQN